MSQSIQRKPDVLRPFGYEIDEAVYVMFRSLVLTGIIVMAAFNAGSKIFTYATGGEVAPVKLSWVVGYMVLMVTICFALAAWHHRNWLATGKLHDDPSGKGLQESWSQSFSGPKFGRASCEAQNHAPALKCTKRSVRACRHDYMANYCKIRAREQAAYSLGGGVI